MTAFLFWNLNRKDLRPFVVDLVERHKVDVLMLVESAVAPAQFLQTANSGDQTNWEYAPGIGCKRVEVFTRFPVEFARPIHETERLTIRHLCPPGRTDILLAVMHFPGKPHWKEGSQAIECVPLSDAIKSAEDKIGHRRTVLVGDFNMSPFDDGVVSAAGLHGVMSRKVAERGSRTVQSREYPFFYNPMWSLMGDETPGPPGSYYYAESDHRAYFWHMYDQVLIRPDLLNCFDHRHLRIVDSADHTPLLNAAGLPNKHLASDHLPLLFQLAL